jgi:nucleoid DNA-binding protein
MDIKVPESRKGNFLNLSDIARPLADKLGISIMHVEQILEELDVMLMDLLLKGFDISFKVGKLAHKTLKPRNAFDPISNKHFITKERTAIKFVESTTIRTIFKGKDGQTK